MPQPIFITDVPELASKWDYELNSEVDISKVTVGNLEKLVAGC